LIHRPHHQQPDENTLISFCTQIASPENSYLSQSFARLIQLVPSSGFDILAAA
jgi:hypothetical protein